MSLMLLASLWAVRFCCHHRRQVWRHDPLEFTVQSRFNGLFLNIGDLHTRPLDSDDENDNEPSSPSSPSLSLSEGARVTTWSAASHTSSSSPLGLKGAATRGGLKTNTQAFALSPTTLKSPTPGSAAAGVDSSSSGGSLVRLSALGSGLVLGVELGPARAAAMMHGSEDASTSSSTSSVEPPPGARVVMINPNSSQRSSTDERLFTWRVVPVDSSGVPTAPRRSV